MDRGGNFHRRTLAEAAWVVNVNTLEAISVARGERSRKVNADIKKEKVKLKLPDRSDWKVVVVATYLQVVIAPTGA